MASVDQAFQAAVEAHRSGKVDEARRLYEQIIERDPSHAQSLSMLGLLVGQAGDWQLGHDQMRCALELYGAHPALLVNLVEACRHLGRHAEAEQYCRHALRLQPGTAGLHNLLAAILLDFGRLEAAIATLRTALRLDPRLAEAHCNLGTALRHQGELHQSEEAFRRALEFNARSVTAWTQLGALLLDQGRWDEAMGCCERTVDLEPRQANSHYNLANVHHARGDRDAAVAAYRAALRIQPDHVTARCNLGNALRDYGRLDEAIVELQEVLRIQPDLAAARNNLATALQDLGRLHEACEEYQRAIERMPELPELHMNLGTVFAEEGRYDEAIACYDKSVSLRPGNYEAQWRRGMAYLSKGEFTAGFAGLATRELILPNSKHDATPRWTGEPLAGRTLFVHTDQGFGDTMQFIRYLKLIPGDGKVLTAVQAEIIPLLQQSGFTELIPNDIKPTHFDTQIALMSLPHVFRTQLDSVPCHVPYLSAAPERVAKWEGTLRRYQGLKVGIVWQGRTTFRGDRLRSIPLAAFTPVAEVQGVQLFSLQKGPGSEQLETLLPRFNIVDLGPQLDHGGGAFVDTAAVMQHLDLVITSDTAAAHLAGALGVRVWVALALTPEWRWMTDREDSPWYPTMRLFRQSVAAEWSDVFERMAAELATLQPVVGKRVARE